MIGQSTVAMYPGCYPVFYENHSNPESVKFARQVNNELDVKMAELKFVYLNNLSQSADLTPAQRKTLNYMLESAKQEFNALKAKNNIR